MLYTNTKGATLASIEILGQQREFRCTSRTLTIYEQEFHSDANPRVTGDMIADVLQKQRITTESLGFHLDENGKIDELIFDYTGDNWNAVKRAFWSMLKTQSEIDAAHGRGGERIPSYTEWDRSMLEWEPDMHEVSSLVAEELNRGLFRAGAAASGKTSEGEPRQAEVHGDM